MTEIIITILSWECLRYLVRKMVNKYKNPIKYE